MLMGVGVGLDWLPGPSGESWNGRRWPGVPTLPDDRDLLGNSFRGLCCQVVGNSRSFAALSRIRRWVDVLMHGTRLSLSLAGGFRGQLDQEGRDAHKRGPREQVGGASWLSKAAKQRCANCDSYFHAMALSLMRHGVKIRQKST